MSEPTDSQETYLWFQVPIYNVIFMQVLKCQDKFTGIELGPFFAKRRLLLKMVKQFTAVHVIQDQIQLLRRLERKFQSDKERGCGLNQNVALRKGVSDLLPFHDILFNKDFHRVNTAWDGRVNARPFEK